MSVYRVCMPFGHLLVVYYTLRNNEKNKRSYFVGNVLSLFQGLYMESRPPHRPVKYTMVKDHKYEKQVPQRDCAAPAEGLAAFALII